MNQAGIYKYEYNLSDHLGNVRYSFDIYGGVVRPLQQDNYYAFGLRYSASGGTNKYLYNGKELQDELGQYDYGARFYDPVIGRWNVVDPLADDYDNVSPYNYVLNSPINFTDPDGTSVDQQPDRLRSTLIDEKGKIIEHKNDGDNSVYQLIGKDKVRIGTELDGVDYNKLIGQQMTSSLFMVNSSQLEAVQINALRKAVPTIPITLIGNIGSKSFGIERLFPGTRLISMAMNIIGLTLEMTNNMSSIQ